MYLWKHVNENFLTMMTIIDTKNGDFFSIYIVINVLVDK